MITSDRHFPQFQCLTTQRAVKIRSTCTRWGYSAMLACVSNGVLLACYLSRPQASLGTMGSGGLSVLLCFLASFTLAISRRSVRWDSLNRDEARFARQFLWFLSAFLIPVTVVSLMPVLSSHYGRFGTGWGLALYVLTLVVPLLLTTVIAVRCHTLFQVPYYPGLFPPRV